MAPAASRITSPLRSILLAVLLSASSLTAASAAPAHRSPHSSELICHTSNHSDCYPREFQPTHEFQLVRDDQDLPPGLHVRINIQTGKKEAKINVPGEQDAALEGVPVDTGSIVVHPSQPDQESHLPKGAPKYSPNGKIKQPPQESSSFAAGLTMLRDGVVRPGHAFDEALIGLEDLSHDIYYGLRLAEDTEAVKALMCLMVSHNSPASAETFIPRDHQAASILAAALQNNPSALRKVADAWPRFKDAKCGRDDSSPLSKTLYTSFTPSHNADSSSAAVKQSASSVKAKVAVINGLIKDRRFRDEFLRQDGMTRLLEVLLPKGQEWDGAQRKAGQLVLDDFLDADMGAQLGQWPRGSRLSIEQCKTEGLKASEGCWDYHVARIMKDNSGDDDHWSADLASRLAKARGQEMLVLGEEHREL